MQSVIKKPNQKKLLPSNVSCLQRPSNKKLKKNILRVVSKNDCFLGKYSLFNKIYTTRYQVM